MGWADTSDLVPRGWTCGYCGNRVGGTSGYYRDSFGPYPMSGAFDESKIYICPHCEKPTAFIVSDSGRVDQVPGPMEGSSVQGVPETVSALYDEIRKCAQAGAYTAAGAGVLALVALAGGFAVAGASATAYTVALMGAAGSRRKLIQFHVRCTSSLIQLPQ